MKIAARDIARHVSRETGLPFEGRTKPDGAIVLNPEGHANAHTFDLVISLGWRSIEIRFEQGAFSGELVRAMGQADDDGRAAFVAVLQSCVSDDATVAVWVNGVANSFNALLWNEPWKTLAIAVRRGQLPLGTGSEMDEAALAIKWTARAAAAVLALLPLDRLEDPADPGALGLPEGAMSRIEVNRYERDRRNRAAALAIHGCACQACGIVLASTYGEVAADFIEIHHVTPVSELGPNYRINPRTDLVPLCPNCHGVIHRRRPPYSVSELREIIARTRATAPSP